MDVTRDDDESQDAQNGPDAGFDLRPRASGSGSTSGSNTRKFVAIGGLVVLVVALGAVLFNGLTDAALFYYNVDEAVAKHDELGDQRFRMQGNVIDGSIVESDTGVEFTLAFGDEQVQVVNSGAPPELFSPKIPVIVEGEFVGDEFHSDQILIRHDSTYDEDNPERIREANDDAVSQSETAG